MAARYGGVAHSTLTALSDLGTSVRHREGCRWSRGSERRETRLLIVLEHLGSRVTGPAQVEAMPPPSPHTPPSCACCAILARAASMLPEAMVAARCRRNAPTRDAAES